ncbi:hypothetical protein AMELA_G00099010 [Ameiurus melas]|uniref:Nuclear mitotic apparatus protein 1 N-terminal hook domain-containing protein n=1 Tax=Ameiurus melas TaxID=219545 RepID=A0A7J6ASL7_AMEME|nr:hypothetical protein AMELA_G00099010 [Ameiurus melas]
MVRCPHTFGHRVYVFSNRTDGQMFKLPEKTRYPALNSCAAFYAFWTKKTVMALHPAKEEAILAWLNGLQLDQPVQRVTDLQDGNLLLKLIYKLKGEEPSQAPMHLPHAERVSIITDFLHSGCHVEECVLLTLAKGRMLELELTKAVLLLCHYGLVNSNLVPKVEYETELQMATMLRYVQQGASGLSLREGLDKLLTTGSLIYSSSVSSMSSLSDNGSPIFSRLHSSPLVRFVELDTVASSSFVGSPIQELMNTPQVQVKRLRKELAREGDVRDELEQELTERINLLSEKEGQISQLQYKLQRLQRDQEEMEKEHKATLTELQEKNNGLLTRVHEVLQQCRDLKTDNSQKERRIDGLMEENGTLAAQARNSLGQLARAEEEVAKISEAHDLSQKEWGNRRDLLQRELSQALTDKECLTERIQILEGKISILEDELEKLSQQPQEKGEVLGPIVEWEKLKQELADLSLKSSQLEETVSLLEKEKMAVETLLAEERSSFEKETLRLEGRVLDLHQSINNIQAEKEAQEQASKTTQETLTSQIAALETDLARLQQLEVQLTVEIAASAELRQQRGALEAKVASLEGMVNMLQSKCQNMEAGNITQQEVLDVVRADLQNAQISLVEYEKKLADHQKVVEENASLRARISALDDTIANLQTEIDAERKRGDELLTAKEQQKALMEEKFQKQEQKAHEMFTELETLSQELRKMKHQKVDSESCIEKLIQEGIDLKASLAEERDRSQSQLALVNKAREAREMELSHHQNKADNLQRQLLEVEGLSRQLTQEVLSKDGEVQHLKVELEQKEGEIHSLKVSLQSLEARSTEMRDLHQNEVEEERLVIMELKLQLAEAEKLLSEKVRTLEDFAQQLKNLKEELSIERQRVSTLENSLKTSKEAHEVQEQSLRLEVTQLQQEIDGHLKKLEESLNEMNSLKEEMSRQQDAALQKEQEVSVLASQNKSLEGNFSQLQNTLAEATALATERQTELLRLQEEVQHQENLRAKAQEIEETRCKELQTEVAELQVRVQELTVLASQREIEFGSLQEKMKEQEDYSQKLAQKSEETLQKELENIVDLKGQLESAKHQTAVKNKLLESMEERLKQMELMYQQKETCASEACQAKETLERKVNELYCMQKQDLDRYQQDLETLKKEKEHLSLVNESLQSEYQNLQMQSKEQQETLNALKNEKDHLASVNQSLHIDLEAAQKLGAEVLEEAVSELRLKQRQELEKYHQQLDALAKEKDTLTTVNHSLQAERKAQQEALNDLQSGLQQEVKTLKKEKEHLSSINQSLQRECDASQRLGADLEVELKGQTESIRAIKEALQKKEKQNQELQEQLRVKTETVEHYKVQVEKAKTHYNGKKQQLLEEQEARRTLQTSLETSESEAKALKSELKLVSMELEKIKASEKCLMVKVKSLETQLDYADRQLREQRKQEGQSVKVKHRESVHVKIPEHPQNASTESLELNLDDSLDAAGGKRSLPGESSTPLVRSSERLAAKRRTQDGGSLETLYFTPLMPRAKKREGAPQDHKLESSIMSLGELTLDSTKKQSSSVQRRRTTQVINITMTKKTPRGGAADDDTDESFFSLHSAQSQPNVASHRTRPVSAEIFDDHDKLLSLPGYRRSTAHGTVPPRTSSVFCLGSEYEPDHLADDWMRIAELQSRNKACLPHMKSSYPLESRPSLGFSHLPVTDEDVRTGDPHETIRRASMVPSQLKDSVTAHRLSLAPPAAVAHGHAPSQHAPQVSKAREVRSTRSPLASKRPAGQVQDLDTPEAKKFVSCFPRTPKGRNLRSISSQNIAPSLADRRQSMAFVIDNTPKKVARGDSSLLQRGISKLRKSPRTASTKSPKITSSAKKLMKLRMKI